MIKSKQFKELEDRIYKLENPEELKLRDDNLLGFVGLSIHECPKCKHRTLHENRYDETKNKQGQDPEYFPYSFFCLSCGTRNALSEKTWVEE